MGQHNTKDTYWSDVEALEARVRALERAVAGSIQTLSSTNASPGTQYIDDLDGKLYFKDLAGVSHALY
jgi:hypothetical protein